MVGVRHVYTLNGGLVIRNTMELLRLTCGYVTTVKLCSNCVHPECNGK